MNDSSKVPTAAHWKGPRDPSGLRPPQGRAVSPRPRAQGRRGGGRQGPAGRPAARARPADRIPAPHPGPGRAACRRAICRRWPKSSRSRWRRSTRSRPSMRTSTSWATDEQRPPKVTIRVCDSLSCMLAGAEKLLGELQARELPEMRVLRAPCIGSCDTAPAAEVGHHHVDHATAAKLIEIARAGRGASRNARLSGLRRLRRRRAATRCCAPASRARARSDDVIAALSDGGLRGLGGAGFPTGRKWGLVRAEKGPRLMAVNGDEGEPGTFKDRYLPRERAAQVSGRHADRGVGRRGRAGLHLHARRVSRRASKILKQEIAKLEAAGLTKHTKLHIRRGAGAYICGEESAMIESIEGKRGLPAASPALRGAGRPVRPADARQQYRDALLGAGHPGEGRGVVRRAGQERRQGPALLLGLGAREEAGRRADGRRLDRQAT